MNELVLFAFLLFTANKTNLFVLFLGEYTAHPNCFWFYQTFTKSQKTGGLSTETPLLILPTRNQVFCS
jgi:hypothetical protein